MTVNSSIIRVGVGAYIKRGDTFLLGLRKGKHAGGKWSIPGGHIEFGEPVAAAVIRETKEETGLDVRVTERSFWGENFFPKEETHTISIIVEAVSGPGEPKIMEPDKMEEWRWVTHAEAKSYDLAFFTTDQLHQLEHIVD